MKTSYTIVLVILSFWMFSVIFNLNSLKIQPIFETKQFFNANSFKYQ
jgi:hypothetical protein